VVTAANLFARSVGSAVGVAVFGAIANVILRSAHPDLARAANHVFIATAVVAMLVFVAVVAMPRVPAPS
jgi:hypothetical protein